MCWEWIMTQFTHHQLIKSVNIILDSWFLSLSQCTRGQRLRAHFGKYDGLIDQLKKRYEKATRAKALMALERDKLRTMVSIISVLFIYLLWYPLIINMTTKIFSSIDEVDPIWCHSGPDNCKSMSSTSNLCMLLAITKSGWLIMDLLGEGEKGKGCFYFIFYL